VAQGGPGLSEKTSYRPRARGDDGHAVEETQHGGGGGRFLTSIIRHRFCFRLKKKVAAHWELSS
jgi:hypothetical protein